MAQGLQLEPEAETLFQCLENSTANQIDIVETWETFYSAYTEGGSTTYVDQSGFTGVISQTDAYLEFTKTLADFSTVFKGCYEGVDSGFYDFWLFMKHYESLGNYLINLVPNILAYALYFNSWSLRIQILDAEENEIELYYVYAVIIRKLFLYDYLPDSLNDDLEPIEFTQI